MPHSGCRAIFPAEEVKNFLVLARWFACRDHVPPMPVEFCHCLRQALQPMIQPG
jgi:hypothetical protein